MRRGDLLRALAMGVLWGVIVTTCDHLDSGARWLRELPTSITVGVLIMSPFIYMELKKGRWSRLWARVRWGSGPAGTAPSEQAVQQRSTATDDPATGPEGRVANAV
jgi:hypothetical protein